MEVGKKTEQTKVELENEAIWQISFFDNDGFAVMTDSAILFYDDDGDRIKRVVYPTTPSGAYIGTEGVLLLMSEADSRYQTVYLYDEDGDCDLKKRAIGGTCQSVTEDSRYYYLSVGKELLTFEKDGDSFVRAELPKEEGVLVSDGDRVYYATSSYAKALDKKTVGR